MFVRAALEVEQIGGASAGELGEVRGDEVDVIVDLTRATRTVETVVVSPSASEPRRVLELLGADRVLEVCGSVDQALCRLGR